jgi:hypothetical protein
VEPTLIDCPECGQPAEIIGRNVLPSTSGPVEHVKVRCLLSGRWFHMPSASLAARSAKPVPAAAAGRV